jgi:hypothetical protein
MVIVYSLFKRQFRRSEYRSYLNVTPSINKNNNLYLDQYEVGESRLLREVFFKKLLLNSEKSLKTFQNTSIALFG